MARTTTRERTIGFYEIVSVEDGEQLRMEQIDFPEMLTELGAAVKDLPKRRWTGDQDLIGQTITVGDTDHMLLHRVKDAGEWLSVIDFQTGNFKELESAASQGYLDTSAFSFPSFGNVVGMMQGSTSSPSHKGLENWLNGTKILGDGVLAVRPLVSKAEVAKLQQAQGARRIDIRIGAHKQASLNERTGRLARFLKMATDEYGDLDVTVTISIPRGKARTEDRTRLLSDLQDLEEVMPDAAEIAKASLIYADAGGAEYTRLAEFVEHHITAKRKVAAVNDKGESIKLSQAVSIIAGVAEEHEGELKAAADVEG